LLNNGFRPQILEDHKNTVLMHFGVKDSINSTKMNLRDLLLKRSMILIASLYIFSLFTRSKQKWLFWRADFYLANQSNLKSFQKALIGWKKSHFCFDHANWLIMHSIICNLETAVLWH